MEGSKWEEWLADHIRDPLTGVLNRGAFFRRAPGELEAAYSRKTGVCLAILNVEWMLLAARADRALSRAKRGGRKPGTGSQNRGARNDRE
jgi:GGDEF domain-containing protein